MLTIIANSTVTVLHRTFPFHSACCELFLKKFCLLKLPIFSAISSPTQLPIPPNQTTSTHATFCPVAAATMRTILLLLLVLANALLAAKPGTDASNASTPATANFSAVHDQTSVPSAQAHSKPGTDASNASTPVAANFSAVHDQTSVPSAQAHSKPGTDASNASTPVAANFSSVDTDFSSPGTYADVVNSSAPGNNNKKRIKREDSLSQQALNEALNKCGDEKKALQAKMTPEGLKDLCEPVVKAVYPTGTIVGLAIFMSLSVLLLIALFVDYYFIDFLPGTKRKREQGAAAS